MKVYRLYVAKPLLFLYLFMLAAFTIGFAVAIAVGAMGKFGPDGPPPWIFVLPLSAMLWSAYYWLRFPYEITLNGDNSIEFRSLLRRTVVLPLDIRSICAKSYSLGFVDIAHAQGTIHLLNQIDGFHDLVYSIKSLNPDVIVKGC